MSDLRHASNIARGAIPGCLHVDWAHPWGSGWCLALTQLQKPMLVAGAVSEFWQGLLGVGWEQGSSQVTGISKCEYLCGKSW